MQLTKEETKIIHKHRAAEDLKSKRIKEIKKCKHDFEFSWSTYHGSDIDYYKCKKCNLEVSEYSLKDYK